MKNFLTPNSVKNGDKVWAVVGDYNQSPQEITFKRFVMGGAFVYVDSASVEDISCASIRFANSKDEWIDAAICQSQREIEVHQERIKELEALRA